MIEKIIRLYQAETLGLAIKGEIGGWVSSVGEKLKSEDLVYNPWAYAIVHRLALECAPTMVSGILKLFPETNSVVDFGSGTGGYIAEFRKHGLMTEGFEYSQIARDIAHKKLGVELQPFDLNTFTKYERDFDLSISIEVAEHLVPELGDRLVNVCCQHAPLVIFTAAPPGQPGQGHINLQPKSYWIDKFAQRGFQFNNSKTEELANYLKTNLIRGFFLADNIGVYQKNR